jgi:hypothetical protein
MAHGRGAVFASVIAVFVPVVPPHGTREGDDMPECAA